MLAIFSLGSVDLASGSDDRVWRVAALRRTQLSRPLMPDCVEKVEPRPN
jgi:hypothetical protein